MGVSSTEKLPKEFLLTEIDADILSEEQISQLRVEYPLIKDSGCTIDYIPLDSMEEFVSFFANSYVAVCTVVEQLEDYTVSVNETLEDSSSLKFDVVFEQYSVKVEESIVGSSDITGETITLAIRKGDKAQYIPLFEGNTVVVPLEAMKGIHQGKYTIAYDVSYYVVDNYLLTAYVKDYGLSGMKLSRAKEIMSEYVE